jgi:predicted homoserine dehydrogenase-like protein
MIIVDRALEQRAEAGQPVRVGMVGAGFMGRGIANQIVNSTPGMQLAAIANRNVDGARLAYQEAGIDDPRRVDNALALDDVAARGGAAVTDDPGVLCDADTIDVIIEVTGTIEYAARVVLDAFAGGKHVVLMNAELDGTVGALLGALAEEAGVAYTACDGDQPGVEMNLYRFVRGIGLRPLLCGNIKGLQDPYRNPTTQEEFARRWGQKPHMVTSFADGTKVSFEQAIVANAPGLTVARRGMYGYDFDGHVDDATHLFDVEELESLGGIVDYLVGARPGPGVFIYATHDDPKQRHYLDLYKLGKGPLYSLYTPYHLCHFEVPLSAARAVLLGDRVLAPAGAPRVEVVARAKTDLRAGQTLDGIGWYHTYGVCERADVTAAERLLPMGVAEGCRLVRDVAKDHTLTYADVDVPPGRLTDDLRRRQQQRFPAAVGAGATA